MEQKSGLDKRQSKRSVISREIAKDLGAREVTVEDLQENPRLQAIIRYRRPGAPHLRLRTRAEVEEEKKREEAKQDQ